MHMKSLQDQAKHRQVRRALRYINPGMTHGSAGCTSALRARLSAMISKATARFYLIVTDIFSETSGGLNG
jgi:hypothetical protein